MATTTTTAFRRKRSDLFGNQGGVVNSNKNDSTRSGKSASSTANEAAAIQESLARTQKLLRNEIARVSTVQDALSTDDKLLSQTMTAHKTMNVKSAKKALTSLQRAKQRERRYLATAVIFFWCSVLYVAWCRIFIRLPFVETIMRKVFRQVIPGAIDYVSHGIEILTDWIIILIDRVIELVVDFRDAYL